MLLGPAGIYNPHLALLAQLAEQLTLNQRVVGSSPTRGIGLFRAVIELTSILGEWIQWKINHNIPFESSSSLASS